MSATPVPYAWANRWPSENQLKTQEIRVNPNPTTQMPAPAKKRGPALAIVLTVIAVMVVLCLGGMIIMAIASKSKPAKDFSTLPTPVLSAGATSVVARDGQFQFTVSALECGVKLPQVQPQGQFCTVALAVKNIGTKPQTFFDANQKARGAGGQEYTADSSAGMYANEANQQVWIASINPGNQVAGKIVFDIPAGAKIASLELHDSALSQGVRVNTP